MKYLFLLTLLFAYSSYSQQGYENLKEESVAIKIGSDPNVIEIQASDAYISIGRTLSRIRIKKENINTVINSNDIVIYMRGKNGKTSFPFSVVKLNDKKKTVQGFYSDDLGKKFEFIPVTRTVVDKEKNIARISVLSILDEGYYAVFFRSKNRGNLLMDLGKYNYRPFVFQIKLS